MSNTQQENSHQLQQKRSKGHVFQIGQRVKRRQNNSSQMTFGGPRLGEIVDLTWKENKSGAVYPTYAVKFDNSVVIDRYVQQMRLIPID